MNKQNTKFLTDALEDAGCSEGLIADVMRCENIDTKRNKLLCYRKSLLKELHTSQKQLDILDYIIRFLDDKEDRV